MKISLWATAVSSAFFSVFCTASFAQSGSFDEPWVACLTVDNWKQMSTAVANNDERLKNSLLGTVCTVVSTEDFSVLGRASAGLTNVRVYLDSGHIDLVIQSEAVR